MYITHVLLWEFKNNKNATETIKKLLFMVKVSLLPACRQGRSSDLYQDTLRELVECKAHIKVFEN